ncbi:MAG: hypothetical protein KDD22_06450 [Bdellovibrionales bacterium]|nr:hypothetical protein [Bdellovibrionales bacterium]
MRDPQPGYLDSVTEERNEVISEMVLTPPPPPKVELKEKIFDDRLTREFQDRYREKFGATDAERNIFSPNRFDEYEYSNGLSVTFDEDRKVKQEFANYMGKRLVEYHVDQYFKSSESLRPVYELKDRVSRFDVEVKKGYKFKMNYSFSGNYLDLNLDNPYDIKARLRYELAGDTILTFGYLYKKRNWFETFFYTEQGKISIVGSRNLGSGVTASLTTTTNYRYPSNTLEGQELIIAGLTWTQ